MAADPAGLAAFRTAAEGYVALIDAVETVPQDRLFLNLLRALSALYGAALELPDIGGDVESLPDTWPREKYWDAFQRIGRALGNSDFDSTVVPFGEDQRDFKELGVFLADDLGDIYVGVKQGLDLLSEGYEESGIVWDWRFGFWSHWGYHAVDALRILHLRIAEDGGPHSPE